MDNNKQKKKKLAAEQSEYDRRGAFSEAERTGEELRQKSTAQLKQEAMDAYLNREDFSYDFNADPLYQMYKGQYLNQGKLAMEDTMGQAASLTGGYGSSYAQNVGQQAYQSYLKGLNDVIPELYQMAYDRYQDQGQEQYQRYDLLAQQEQREYDRDRDAVLDQQWEQEQAEDKRQFDLGYALDQQAQAEDKRQFDLGYALDQQAQAEDKRQFDLGYALDQQGQAEDKRQFDLGYALDQQTLEQKKKNTGTTSVGYGDNYYAWLSGYQGLGERADVNDPTSVTEYDNGNVSTGHILTMQRLIGVEENGMWTKEAKRAAGGLSADEAWAAYQKGQLQNRQSVALGDMGISTPNIRAMERAIGTKEDGAWDSWDAEAAGGLTQEEAWELFQRGILQNR